MTKPSTPSIHSDGWWDHMPPGHDLNIIMNSGELPSSLDGTISRPTRRKTLWLITQPTSVVMAEPSGQTRPVVDASSRRIKRSHVSAWIMVAAVGATGGALAMAAVRDPQSLREHLDAAMAEVKNLTGSSSATTTALTTAPAAAPAPTPVQETAPVTTAQATVPAQSLSSDAPLPFIAPAAGHSVIHPVPVTAAKQLAMPVPSTSRELVADSPQVMPSLPPRTELEPVQPLVAPVQPMPLVPAQPLVQPPPVLTPVIVQPPVEAAPSPVQPPASSPQ